MLAGVATRPKDPRLPLLATAGWVRDYIGLERHQLMWLVGNGKVHSAKVADKVRVYRVPDILAAINEYEGWRRENGLDEDAAWIEEQLKKEYRE